MTTTEKTCFKCRKTLPLGEFYRHKAMGDGHLNKCKECTKKDSYANRQNNLEKVRSYDRSRGNRQGSGYTRSYRAANKEKYKAHTEVAHALRAGRIEKTPCACCGSLKTEAHHPDYSKPLDVVWLCSACHSQVHATANRVVAKEMERVGH